MRHDERQKNNTRGENLHLGSVAIMAAEVFTYFSRSAQAQVSTASTCFKHVGHGVMCQDLRCSAWATCRAAKNSLGTIGRECLWKEYNAEKVQSRESRVQSRERQGCSYYRQTCHAAAITGRHAILFSGLLKDCEKTFTSRLEVCQMPCDIHPAFDSTSSPGTSGLTQRCTVVHALAD